MKLIKMYGSFSEDEEFGHTNFVASDIQLNDDCKPYYVIDREALERLCELLQEQEALPNFTYNPTVYKSAYTLDEALQQLEKESDE